MLPVCYLGHFGLNPVVLGPHPLEPCRRGPSAAWTPRIITGVRHKKVHGVRNPVDEVVELFYGRQLRLRCRSCFMISTWTTFTSGVGTFCNPILVPVK